MLKFKLFKFADEGLSNIVKVYLVPPWPVLFPPYPPRPHPPTPLSFYGRFLIFSHHHIVALRLAYYLTFNQEYEVDVRLTEGA